MRALSQVFGVLAFFSLLPAILELLFKLNGDRGMPFFSLGHIAVLGAEGLAFALLSQWLLRRSKRAASAPNAALERPAARG